MFIAIEGSNGSGKGTLIEGIHRELIELGERVTLTREPGGTKAGEELRKKVLSVEMEKETELLLFSASRALNIIDVIKPALDRGEIVITDRFDDSSRAFQHYARGISLEKVEESIKDSLNGVKPDLYILLDISAEDGLARASSRNDDQLDKLEKESISFLEKARQGFLEIAKNSNRHLVIDANLPRDVILSEALKKIKSTLKDKQNERV